MKLIDKNALETKMENILDYVDEHWDTDYAIGAKRFVDKLQDAIDTLDMKEVDLEKEIDDYMTKNWEGIEEDKHLFDMIKNDLRDIAKHFFELGLRSTITEEDCKLIWNIGDEIPNMPEEEFFKELLKRYKAQKGE